MLMKNPPHPGRIIRQECIEALRLARAFGGGPEMWLGLQMDYDLAQAQKKAGKIKVRDLRRAE